MRNIDYDVRVISRHCGTDAMLEITGFNRTTNHSVVLRNYMHGKFHVLAIISSFKIYKLNETYLEVEV